MHTSLVVTSINQPNAALRSLAAGAQSAGYPFILIGDKKSPADFKLDGCDYFDLARQNDLVFEYAQTCPTGHYARKNIGYLVAMQGGAEIIVETDDDNHPRPEFFDSRSRAVSVALAGRASWINIYCYFSENKIWPRGLPLDAVECELGAFDALPVLNLDCPIQQGLADENPDVDAIYRLLMPLPQSFRGDRQVAIEAGSWCPFNSQNTTWWRDAFPLLYLPAHCSFRMTDIWRSFVAQRIAWENGWHVMFHGATVWQERNVHDLMRDFAEEVPGYLNNRKIQQMLDGLSLAAGTHQIGDNLRICYQRLVEMQLIGDAELGLLDAWLDDLVRLGFQGCARS
jgi:hypothetical protein